MVVFPLANSQNALCTAASDSLSRLDVASSNTIIGASSRKTRAIPTRCLCPPESLMPLSHTMVSSQSGSESTNSVRYDFFSASWISFSVASGRP